MPVDFQSIHAQVRVWGEEASQVTREQQQHRQEAGEVLHDFTNRVTELKSLVERAIDANPDLRCAQPVLDGLETCYPLPKAPPEVTLLAADGSQVIPNPHGRVEFGVVNIGVFQMCSGQTDAPLEWKHSLLINHQQLYAAGSLIGEREISMLRDLQERKYLAELASRLPGPVLALTDGPLEIFSERVYRESGDFREKFEHYLEMLRQLSELGAIAAGYVDRPRYDLIVRLLELAALDPRDIAQAGRLRPFAGVRDRDLYANLLAPGERSGVFRIQSSSAREFEGPLALHFFYLNVGREEAPSLARVELPAWVAGDAKAIDILHATLFYQSRLLGTRPYPYALHRAHEIALISLAEAEQLEQMLLAELIGRGVFGLELSNKQYHKQLSGRTSHKI